jgi:hypothetical protein
VQFIGKLGSHVYLANLTLDRRLGDPEGQYGILSLARNETAVLPIP